MWTVLFHEPLHKNRFFCTKSRYNVRVIVQIRLE
jgi:hypothetical protein